VCRDAVSAYTKKRKERNPDLESKLGDTDWLLETGPQVDVGLEAIDRDVVVMNGHLVHVAIIAALVDEIGHPSKPIGSGGGDGAAEGITFVSERPDVGKPKVDDRFNRNVGLTLLVDPRESGSIQVDG
jgi:hypothetical protein